MIYKKQQVNSSHQGNTNYLHYLKSFDLSIAYETYWSFACKRQDIYFSRLKQEDRPWTQDPVLNVHKFTNAYRASDRVSQYLIKNVIYRDDLPNSAEEIFFRIMLFKLFNKIETWELLEQSFGSISFKDYSFDAYDKVLQKAMERKFRIYSAAYIIPPASSFGFDRKHQNHLQLLQKMMSDNLVGKLAKTNKMKQAFELIKAYPTMGDFLAYQFVTDINYSEITNFSEMEFVVPGPGARDGLRKCFKDNKKFNEQELIQLMADHQEEEFSRLGLSFKSLWGRPLQLIDCQNLFCEVDKYSRVAHPEIMGVSGRTRIKQKYNYTGELEQPWFPPKWNINEKIAQSFTLQTSR